MARPPTYHTDAEKPVTVSVRIPRALYAQAQQYVSMRRTTLTEVLLDGLRLRLETPADPRDVLVSQDTTVMQELQEMIRAAVHKEIGTLSDFLGPQARAAGLLPTPAAPPSGGIQHDENTTGIQELAKPAYLVDACLPFDEDLAPALGALAGPPPAILPDATPGGQDTVPPAPATIEAQIDQHITRLEDRIHEMHALNGESEATVRAISQDDNNTVIQETPLEVAVMPPDNIQYYDNNTVMQEETVQASDTEGTPGQTATGIARGQRPRPGPRGISPGQHEAIAAEYHRCGQPPLAKFAMHLFDTGIYRATATDGTATPVSTSALHRWIKRAHEAGMR